MGIPVPIKSWCPVKWDNTPLGIPNSHTTVSLLMRPDGEVICKQNMAIHDQNCQAKIRMAIDNIVRSMSITSQMSIQWGSWAFHRLDLTELDNK